MALQKRTIAAFVLLSALLCAAADRASAQPLNDSAGASPGAGRDNTSEADDTASHGFFDILVESGWVGLLILLLSIAAAALIIEHGLTIRANVLIPPGLGDRVRENLQGGQVTQAMQQCKLLPSMLSHVVQSGLAEIDGKWSAMEKAMEDATADQAARLHRKIEYLSVIGNIAPMLGLLGTVFGVITAFQELSAGEAGPAKLASGIYLALVTTAEGLIVAIPSLAAYAYFRNKVDQLVSETAYAATRVFTPFKRRKAAAPAGRA